MKVQIIIPTFEPDFIDSKDSSALKDFYVHNFTSWFIDAQTGFEITVILSDHRSSDDFRNFLKKLAGENEQLEIKLGDVKRSSVDAFNLGINRDIYADVYVYAASDTSAGSEDWAKDLEFELRHTPDVGVIFTTSNIGVSETCDQIQSARRDVDCKLLSHYEEPIPNVVFFTREIMQPYDFRIGDIFSADLTGSLIWMAKSVNLKRILSYRLYVNHDHFLENGRHDRGSSSGFIKGDAIKVDIRARKNLRYYFLMCEGLLPKRRIVLPWSSVIPNFKILNAQQKRFLFLRFFYTLFSKVIKFFLIKTHILYIVKQIELHGLFRYLFNHSISVKQISYFESLSRNDRISLVKKYFFR